MENVHRQPRFFHKRVLRKSSGVYVLFDFVHVTFEFQDLSVVVVYFDGAVLSAFLLWAENGVLFDVATHVVQLVV